ncbi:MAG TPA: bifunctional DNA-formamidopyrimidine glycosylase/DNA-(apurinic or apyrimidinic site) lyase, partial [bacterium]|nr:bifunctional DNA-formamidopyrimidine glycosylase/DNA-(apurinic or apyrimidinic site) lyase [bacterium]
TDVPERIKNKQAGDSSDFAAFQRAIVGAKIKEISRRGKYLLFQLSRGLTLVVHQKMTGHFLVGRWRLVNRKWLPRPDCSLSNDPANRFLHLVFTLDNGQQLALSDARKFARIELYPAEKFADCPVLKSLGPEAWPDLNFNLFCHQLRRRKGKIKTVLLNQEVMAGLGNIYTDELLFAARIHPLTPVSSLSSGQMQLLFRAMKRILSSAVAHGGTSFSDYRKADGQRGTYSRHLKVYGRYNQPCFRCGSMIQRVRIGSRFACFCPDCQSAGNFPGKKR